MQNGHAVNKSEIQDGGQIMAVMVGIFEEDSGEFVLHHPELHQKSAQSN